ncbi:uncharacterized protein LOC107786327 [Nicotiana tabacum]|uniref:Uncharacterized protein n=1 Tax=Nicotiana tabacum TaxID=4097 RepID=A0A1S3ZFP7_TOBAC|nr:PREDICTED: uncharacterized protein LOC107786327 [Nicotiana tabacum]XP_016463271.1 PREDICTED: uncharacterized protein LOC107786327 [Nicotiana tabacum]XP_016463272.1 PREDICTED: uncharacterized protein LOC107786327 [Nicotiana tabacum]XP_016463273.1 PREDICTED: uncharacterized protein LOC107786327 [Nicotiana tabacum]
MGSSERLRSSPMVYRNLLKAVEKHIGKEEHKVHFTDFIREEFRKKSNLECPKDPSFIQRRINLAQNYAYLLNSVHHHKDLLFSYNIAVDRSDEMTKVLGKSAASVGLRLPDVYQS